MPGRQLTRSLVKANIKDSDRVFLAENHTYIPQKEDHRQTWPKIVAAIGEKGAWYSTLRAIAGQNKDYVAYLIGNLGALRCPELEKRMEIAG